MAEARQRDHDQIEGFAQLHPPDVRLEDPGWRVSAGRAGAGTSDHRRRDVDGRERQPRVRQRRRHPSGAAADLEHRPGAMAGEVCPEGQVLVVIA